MNIILCLDDKNGIQFNRRRQSRDQVVCDRVLDLTKGSTLWMNEYSAKMFADDRIKADEDFLRAAKAGDYCFVESTEFLEHSDKIEKVIVYRWNKVYPSDVKIDSAFFRGKVLTESLDFAGNSHEKITQEMYI